MKSLFHFKPFIVNLNPSQRYDLSLCCSDVVRINVQNLQDREQIQLSFCAGKIKGVVATVAFGMGGDAQGVRGVVHMTLPRSLEEYVQQVIC